MGKLRGIENRTNPAPQIRNPEISDWTAPVVRVNRPIRDFGISGFEVQDSYPISKLLNEECV
jgi:hypothetical protein